MSPSLPLRGGPPGSPIFKTRGSGAEVRLMYGIDRAPYGFRLTFGGFIQKPEMEAWLADSRKLLAEQPGPFGVLIDLRALTPIGPDVREVMEEGQALYREAGLRRSCVIVASAMTSLQFKDIAQRTGIHDRERYLKEASRPDWEQAALDWIRHGKEPGGP